MIYLASFGSFCYYMYFSRESNFFQDLLSLGVCEGEAGFRVAAILAEGAGVQVDA